MYKKISGVDSTAKEKNKKIITTMVNHQSHACIGANLAKPRPLPKWLKRLFLLLDPRLPYPTLPQLFPEKKQTKPVSNLITESKTISLNEKLSRRFFTKPMTDITTGYSWRFPFKIFDRAPKGSNSVWLYQCIYLHSKVNPPSVQTEKGKKFRPATKEEIQCLVKDLHKCFGWDDDHTKKRTYYAHRVSAAFESGFAPMDSKTHVHHVNLNTLDNDPSNLVILEDWEHFLHHIEDWTDMNPEEIEEYKLKAKERYTREQNIIKKGNPETISLESLVEATLAWDYPSQAKALLENLQSTEMKDFYYFGRLLEKDLRKAKLTKAKLLDLHKQSTVFQT